MTEINKQHKQVGETRHIRITPVLFIAETNMQHNMDMSQIAYYCSML